LIIIANQRTQHPVGQGLFHTGDLGAYGPQCLPIEQVVNGAFRYVYDCGAIKAQSASRDREIDAYRASFSAGSPNLNVLFVSHFHADHVNGIGNLLRPGNSGQPAPKLITAVFPYTDVVDRLLVFASSLERNLTRRDDAWYRAILTDPVAAAHAWGAQRVVLIQPSAPPNPPGPTDPAEGEDLFPEPPDVLGIDVDWEAVIGAGQPADPTESGGFPEGSVHVVPDSTLLPLVGGGLRLNWMFLTHVDRPANYSVLKAKFLRALTTKLGRKKSVEWLEKKLRDPDPKFRRDLMQQRRRQLSEAYRVCGNLNHTSLSLYSGPVSAHDARWRHDIWPNEGTKRSLHPHGERCVEFVCESESGRFLEIVSLPHRPSPPKLAWIGTGDANLRAPARSTRFLDHFRNQLPVVGAMTLPHHGSRANSCQQLFDDVRPTLCVTSADPINPNWKHPASEVVRQASNAGALVYVTTQDPRSRATELAQLFQL